MSIMEENRAQVILARQLASLVSKVSKVRKDEYATWTMYDINYNQEAIESLLSLVCEYIGTIDEDIVPYYPTRAEVDALNTAERKLRAEQMAKEEAE